MRESQKVARPMWSPAPRRPALGIRASNQRESLGLALLSALSVAGVWAAVCPSYFTLRSFASQPEARQKATEGLWIGLGLSTLASGAVWLVFDEFLPAVVSEVTALALFGIGYYAVRQPPVVQMRPIEQQFI